MIIIVSIIIAFGFVAWILWCLNKAYPKHGSSSTQERE